MTITLEMEQLKNENQKLRNYIALLSGEIELTQRILEIRENFSNPGDCERITTPIFDRLVRIHSEKLPLQKELHLI